jgi:hypothetical protein
MWTADPWSKQTVQNVISFEWLHLPSSYTPGTAIGSRMDPLAKGKLGATLQ